jgi:hypothetical protein
MIRCLDFSMNPYATVLIPEPMDYFAACGATSMCEAKCNAEYSAFDRQLVLEAVLHSNSPVTKNIERTTESMLFVDLDEDAYTPMNIMAMVELSDCRLVLFACMHVLSDVYTHPFAHSSCQSSPTAGWSQSMCVRV